MEYRHPHRTGLVERVKASDLSEAAAEAEMLAFMSQYVPEKPRPCVATRYISKPPLHAKIHATIGSIFPLPQFDVSTLKELAKRWHPEVAKGVVKKGAHQALADIEESRRNALLP